ncbi:MAG: ABC transporter ATP-binding protein [Candidatus Pacebacteria bacterium]|nr:ABC transporter ATP-binding protein [Candidatus Paceibacterota bacterium]
MENVLELKDVWKIYDLGKIKLEVLRGVSFYIKKGDFVVVLGPSGSGKSTLLNMMSCLDVPTKGQVFLDGKDVSVFSEDKLAIVRGEKIGFVFQQFNLLPHLTAIQNVVLPTLFRGTSFQEKTERAKEILSSVGLSSRLNHKPSELSGGEKQRVAISRALINNPEIIVADEPTGNVDSKTGAHIMELLENLNKKEGRTVVVVTHDAELEKFSNKIIRIRDGNLIKK